MQVVRLLVVLQMLQIIGPLTKTVNTLHQKLDGIVIGQEVIIKLQGITLELLGLFSS
jgi:hypothetical protein